MERKKFETKLPPFYHEVAHVRSNEMKTGFWCDLKAMLPGLVLTAIGWITVRPTVAQTLVSLAVFVAAICPYFTLHEIVHGMVVKSMTRQRVEIGFHRYGMYCGMPDLYLYQSVAVNCTAAPLAVFSILFGVGAIFLIAFGRWTFLPLGLLMSLHLFGCRADVHLLEALRKYESASLLVKDTGSEQWLYDRKQKESCHTVLQNCYDDRSG